MPRTVPRRDFLRQTGGAVALSALPLPLRAMPGLSSPADPEVSGQPMPDLERPLPDAPDRRVGFALVGLGAYALNQIAPNLANTQHGQVAALVSGNGDKARAVADAYGVGRDHVYSYETFDRIADDPDVDVVYVILPNVFHRAWTERAFAAGKHVLCEKPMAATADDCRAMIEAGARARKRLMIGYRAQFDPYNLRAAATPPAPTPSTSTPAPRGRTGTRRARTGSSATSSWRGESEPGAGARGRGPRPARARRERAPGLPRRRAAEVDPPQRARDRPRPPALRVPPGPRRAGRPPTGGESRAGPPALARGGAPGAPGGAKAPSSGGHGGRELDRPARAGAPDPRVGLRLRPRRRSSSGASPRPRCSPSAGATTTSRARTARSATFPRSPPRPEPALSGWYEERGPVTRHERTRSNAIRYWLAL